MLLKLKKNKVLMAFLWAIFAFCCSICYNISPIFQFDAKSIAQIPSEVMVQIVMIVVISGLVISFTAFISYIIGVNLREKIELKNNKIDKKGVLILLLVGVVLPVIIGVLDYFQAYSIYSDVSFDYIILYAFTSIFYSGIMEEIILRYGVLTLFGFMFYWVSKKFKKLQLDKSTSITVAIVFCSVLMFLVEVFVLFQNITYTPYMWIRAILIYFVPTLAYNYLYTKYSLKFTMIVHILFIVLNLGAIPLVLNMI